MISRAEFDAYNRALDGVVTASQRVTRARIAAWMSEHPGAGVAETRDAAIEILDGGIQVSGDTAASVAARWYDEQAFAHGLDLENAITATVYDRDAVEQAVRTMARDLESGDTEQFLKVCADYAGDRARRSANMTVLRNARRDRGDGVRFARVPTGAETCSFCFMLATRGAVYWTRATAGEMSKFHHRCDCKIVPGFKSDKHAELVEGWRPRDAYDRLKLIEKQCGAEVGSKWKANDAVTRSMRLRDPNWLYYGKKPKIEYVDGSVREKKSRNRTEREQHALELRTAEKLNKLGVKTVFQNDEIVDRNGLVIGLPDLENGIEIKTVYQAASENSISRHISRGVHKRGVSAVVIDVSENPNLSDEDAKRYIANSLRRHGASEAYILKHDGTLSLITQKNGLIVSHTASQ